MKGSASAASSFWRRVQGAWHTVLPVLSALSRFEKPELSQRLRDPDYGATCRARLYRDRARSGLPAPTTAAPSPEPVVTHPVPANPTTSATSPVPVVPQAGPAGSKSLFARPLRYLFLTSSTFAAVLTLPLPAVDLPELLGEVRWAVANVISGADVIELRHEPLVDTGSASADPPDGLYEAAAERDAPAEPRTEFASLKTALRTSVAPEPPHVTVPEVAPVLADAIRPAAPEQAHQPRDATVAAHSGSEQARQPRDTTVAALSAPEQARQPRDTAVTTHSGSAGALAPADRDLIVQKGNETLARGDVSGARLLFRRAAEWGDARGAAGMARTFDPEVLRMLRVYGVRPDPDQAAHWYARSKALETVISAR